MIQYTSDQLKTAIEHLLMPDIDAVSVSEVLWDSLDGYSTLSNEEQDDVMIAALDLLDNATVVVEWHD